MCTSQMTPGSVLKMSQYLLALKQEHSFFGISNASLLSVIEI